MLVNKVYIVFSLHYYTLDFNLAKIINFSYYYTIETKNVINILELAEII